MRYLREVTLADGESILLRSLETKDAGAAIFCFRKVAGETQFLLRETDECGITIAQEEETIARKLESPREMLLGVFAGEALIGMAGLNACGRFARVRHRAGIGVSLVKAHWGKGIGKAMLQTLIDAAKQAGYEQLELDVVDNNDRARTLYERFGFEAVGRLPRAMKYSDGRYADLILMVCELSMD